MTRPKYPEGLEAKGRRLWAEVKAARPSLGPGEALMLEEACRMFDRLDRLAKTLSGETFVEFIEDEDDSSEDSRTYVLHVSSAMAEARLTATALRGYMLSLGLTSGLSTAEDDKAKGPKGGRRAPKVVGADEANTKPEQAKPDPLDEIERRRQQREQMG